MFSYGEVGYGPLVVVHQNTVYIIQYIHNSITCTDIHVYVYKTHEVYTPGWLLSLQLDDYVTTLSLSNKTQNAHNIACTDSHLQMYWCTKIINYCVDVWQNIWNISVCLVTS